ncbi:PD-(D/E)XK nuclease family protein [Brevibacterium sp. CSND-B09]|uniref:PD-(D/E)XK nuclease family protein n=1 Tax=Brevibacterium sp. CSND-B09 TaxID=3462571 RepID=UPI00406AAE8C
MRIEFGWTLDRAPWKSHSSAEDSNEAGTTVVTGPLGLLGILQTRLGTTRPTVERPVRIAQYRSLLAQADHPWYRRSFASDPWNTAHHLLQLRDDAIEAGWHPTTDDQDYTSHPRLDALAAVEEHVTLGPPHDPSATLASGRVDDLREVLELLRLHGTSWPLGIDTIELRDRRNDLPPVWQDIVSALRNAGVTIAEACPSTKTPELTIVRGQDEWSTAEAAARYLANVSDCDRICIIAGDSTTVLDQQLARRHAPALGVPNSSPTTPSAQVLPVFLSAVLPPTDIRRVAEFLHLSFGSDGPETPALTLVPRSASSTLLSALTQEPGISGDPASAWMKALEILKARANEDPDTATKAWETAQTLDGLLRVSPPAVDDDHLAVSSLQPALDWLSTRLRKLTLRQQKTTQDARGTTASFLAEASNHIASFRAALTALDVDTLRVRELFDIAESCAPQSAHTSVSAQAAAWTVVNDPSEVPTNAETIVWWSSCRTTQSEAGTWDSAEIEALAAADCQISPATERERLRQAAELRGLRSAKTLLCFCPDTVRGEGVSLHPVLSRLVESLTTADPEQFATSSVDAVLSHPAITKTVATLVEDGSWRLNNTTVATDAAAIEVVQPPQTVSRTLDGDFTHLVPETLSYTQIDQLLSDPLEWTLNRALGLSHGYTFDIPADNRMIGTLVHAVVQHLVDAGETSGDNIPTPSVIAKTFDRLVPRFASELLLPGQLTRRNTIRSTALTSLTHLFTALKERGVHLTAAEADFTYEWSMTIAGTSTMVSLRGQRDLEGTFDDGRPSIVDLKWANYDKRYRTMIDEGEAVQLSVYSRTADTPTGAKPLTSYFMLKQGRFVSTDSALDPNFTGGAADSFDDVGNGLGGDPAGLWPIIQRSVETALTHIATGRFDSPSGDVHAELQTAPGVRSTDVTKALKAFKEEELADQRLFVIKPQSYSDFNLIYGIAGDHS